MTVPGLGAHVDLRDLGKAFVPDEWLFRGLSDQIYPGEIRAIVGRSGSGKSTLLRIIAGLDFPNEGSVLLDDQEVREPPRGLGLVVQDYSRSLFPWLKVHGNLRLALMRTDKPKSSWATEIHHFLHQVGLDGVHDKFPWELSGGMQQRVALARALISEPRLVLLDEPFASVDAFTRLELQVLTRSLIKESGATALLVTHDLDEAVFVADTVSVLEPTTATLSDPIQIELEHHRTYPATRTKPRFGRYVAEIYELLGSSGI
jgi:NitT/TauT family transport system ATP-binding protein